MSAWALRQLMDAQLPHTEQDRYNASPLAPLGALGCDLDVLYEHLVLPTGNRDEPLRQVSASHTLGYARQRQASVVLHCPRPCTTCFKARQPRPG